MAPIFEARKGVLNLEAFMIVNGDDWSGYPAAPPRWDAGYAPVTFRSFTISIGAMAAIHCPAWHRAVISQNGGIFICGRHASQKKSSVEVSSSIASSYEQAQGRPAASVAPRNF